MLNNQMDYFFFLKPTAPGISGWSPIQLLTKSDPAYLPRSEEIRRVEGSMAIAKWITF